jgi:hypothetical protein
MKAQQCSLPPDTTDVALRLAATVWFITCAAKLNFIGHCSRGQVGSCELVEKADKFFLR